MSIIPAATIEHLNWSYRTKPLFHDLNTTFVQDAFIAIVGPNGSGKTTLLKHLLGSVTGKTGVVKLFNQPLHEYSQRHLAQRVSYVPQQSKLEYDFTVYECVAMGRYAHTGRLSMLQPEDHRLIQKALESVELDHLHDRNAVELSGGEYQRMLIARALAQQASLIVLDEPVSHLDIHNQREILRLLRSLVDQKIATVLCVLHDLNAVSAYSDLIVMMQEGAIVAEGTVHEVLTKKRIESVYRIQVTIVDDPTTDRPLIIPQWRI
jgi:iron complex transport system ATP-binding protein